LTLHSPQERKAESPAAAISQIATNPKCDLLDVDFSAVLRECVLRFFDCTITSQFFRLPTGVDSIAPE
jgi:hypothetical protein